MVYNPRGCERASGEGAEIGAKLTEFLLLKIRDTVGERDVFDL